MTSLTDSTRKRGNVHEERVGKYEAEEKGRDVESRKEGYKIAITINRTAHLKAQYLGWCIISRGLPIIGDLKN